MYPERWQRRVVGDKMGGWWTALDAVCLLWAEQHQQFPIGAYCWADADKACERETEQLVSMEGDRRKEKPGMCQEKSQTINISIYIWLVRSRACSFFMISCTFIAKCLLLLGCFVLLFQKVMLFSHVIDFLWDKSESLGVWVRKGPESKGQPCLRKAVVI